MAKESASGQAVLAFVRALGIGDPDDIRRVVIDIGVDCVPIVHVERFLSPRALEVARHLEGVKIEVKEVD